MRKFPVTVLDNFYENPDLVRQFALSLDNSPDPTGRWPGKRSLSLHKVNRPFFDTFCGKLFNLFYDLDVQILKYEVDTSSQSISNFSEKCLKDTDESIFYNYEHLNFSSTFSFAANKLAYYSFALCILSLNFLGFVNLQMTNSKINEIEQSKQQIFSAYFPNTEFKSADNHLLTLKNNYLNSPTNTLSNLGNIFTSISNLEYIQSFKQKGKEPSIELNLKIPNNELADVENYLLTKNIPLKLVNKTVLENYTNITYEIDAN